MPQPQERNSKQQTQTTTAIGAFCSDIADSTERVERFDQLALTHHKVYLESAGTYLNKVLTKTDKKDYEAGDLWAPGDSLWGIFYPSRGKTLSESVRTSLWRTILSFTYGLTVANSSRPSQVDPLRIRGVFLAGRVLQETFYRFRLYNGRALNTCGRLEKYVDPNTIVAGFVVDVQKSKKPAIELVARSPRIEASGSTGLAQYLRMKAWPPNAGCKIRLDVVSDDHQQLLRFKGWQKREALRGLGSSRVLITTIRLEPKTEKGLEVAYDASGRWDREQRSFLCDRNGSKWDLIDLLDGHVSFDFVKQIYKRGEIEVFVDPQKAGAFELRFNRKTDRPRINKLPMAQVVDFNSFADCVLPTNTHPVSGGQNILIQTYLKSGKRALCVSSVSDDLTDAYDDLSDFFDSGVPTIEFTFSSRRT